MTIVTLTTDFGSRDPWVGIVKGVILARCPTARLVDLTHEVSAQDVLEGMLVLAAAVPYFPPGTVHLAVVDPGVGSERRPLAVEAGGQRFVGPDNGLLSVAYDQPGWRAVRLTAPAHQLTPLSRTFHGRDVFAPAAAALAGGIALEALGPRVDDPRRLEPPRARRDGPATTGEVVRVDRFGNLLTSITAADVTAVAGPVVVEVGGQRVPLVDAYAAVAPGQAAGIVGSEDRLEVFVRDGSAAVALGLGRGAVVRVRPS